MHKAFAFLLLLVAGGVARSFEVLPPSAERIVFPAHENVIDVTKPPYSAKGDGLTATPPRCSVRSMSTPAGIT